MSDNGWINPVTYAPMAMLAWNAVTTKINDKGQVEGTCVGTGMAFDPIFYYYRPTNVFADMVTARLFLRVQKCISS